MNWGAVSRLQRSWDVRAAANFIGGGTGSTLLAWSALGLAANLPYAPAAFAGVLFVAAGLVMVWLETGRPWRALNLFFRPRTSWMTREGIVALPLLACGVVAASLDAGLLPGAPAVLLPISASAAALFGAGFLYCQLRILNAARGLPAWRESRAMWLLAVSGLTEGLGVYLVFLAFTGIAAPVLGVTLLFLLGGRALVFGRYVAALEAAGSPDQTRAALSRMRRVFLFIGHLLPALLLMAALVPSPTATWLAAAGSAVAAFAGWYLKIVLVTKAAYIPRFDVPAAPVRGRRPPDADVHHVQTRRPT